MSPEQPVELLECTIEPHASKLDYIRAVIAKAQAPARGIPPADRREIEDLSHAHLVIRPTFQSMGGHDSLRD